MHLHRTLDFCIASTCAVLRLHRDKIKTFYTLFKMASQVEHEIEEIQPKKQGTGQGISKNRSDSETDKLIDLLEKHFCLWDVSKKEYHLRNLRRRIHALVFPLRLRLSSLSSRSYTAKHLRFFDVQTCFYLASCYDNTRHHGYFTLTCIHWIANVQRLYNTFVHRYYTTLYIIHCRLYMYSIHV